MDAPGYPDDILTPDDLEREWKITKTAQAVMRHRGQIPFFRLGGGRIIRYSRAALREHLAASAVAPRPAVVPLAAVGIELEGRRRERYLTTPAGRDDDEGSR